MISYYNFFLVILCAFLVHIRVNCYAPAIETTIAAFNDDFPTDLPPLGESLPSAAASEPIDTDFPLVSTDSSLLASNGQWSSTYATHSNYMLDQERGTYVMQTYYTSRWSSVSVSEINSWKKSYYNTLVLLLINLDNYKSSDISAASLTQINAEFQIYRSAGIKTIIRFIYNDNMGSKPWGDATTAAVVFRHIDQLAPILKLNEDVIAYVQAGFVGLWGEWYYTDSFGDQGSYSAQNKADRKTLVSKLMTALPNRAVQIRTPYWMKSFYGSNPLTAANYASELGRAAHHNDCYLASSSDYGTYENFASEYAYLQQQSKFTPTIFETCATSTRSTCATALKETAELHMVSGHRMYNTAVWNQWISGGCYDTIMKNMGHRLQFESSSVDLQTSAGSTFAMSVVINNVGYAAPSNARKTEVVLRKVDDASICIATLNFDARTLYSATKNTINAVIRVPSGIAAGRYEVLIQFADPFSTLYAVPWYKIQAANTGIYESGTGMHKLNAIIDIVSSGSASSTQSGEVVARCGLSINAVANATITSADTSCMAGYYKVGSTCTYCPPGFQCATAASTPVACAAGLYSAGGQTACTSCPSTCSARGQCQVKSGACLCQTGFSGYDCSIASGSTTSPATVTPTTVKPATVSPTTSKPATVAPSTVTPSTAKPSVAPSTVTPTTAKPVVPTTVLPTTTPSTIRPSSSSPTTSAPTATTVKPTTGTSSPCPRTSNLLANPLLGGVRKNGETVCPSWTNVDDGYSAVTRRQQPSIKLAVFDLNRSEGVTQSVTLSSPTQSSISFGAYISGTYITGSPDNKFALSVTLAYTDGTTERKSVNLPIGSYGWAFKSMSFVPTKPVTKIDYTFAMSGHTGYAYMTQPVLAVATSCSVNGNPAAFEGATVLADDGSDAETNSSSVGDANLSSESSSSDMDTIIWVGAGVGGFLFLVVIIAGVYVYRKRATTRAIDHAIHNQLTQV